jgi:(R,R)-butanediol dehydrogenase/meso-butanediol dehydrogenase/diacetyl reductase
VSQTNAPFRLFVNEIGFNERVLIGTVAYCGEFAPAIQLIAEGKVRAGEMITARIGLEQLVDVGYRELMEHTDQHVKIIVSPNA